MEPSWAMVFLCGYLLGVVVTAMLTPRSEAKMAIRAREMERESTRRAMKADTLEEARAAAATAEQARAFLSRQRMNKDAASAYPVVGIAMDLIVGLLWPALLAAWCADRVLPRNKRPG